MRERSGRRARGLALAALLVAPLALLAVLGPMIAQAASPPEAAGEGSPPEVLKWGFLAAAAVSGLSALGAAYAVAVVGGAAMGAVAEKPDLAGRAIVFVGLAEGIAIYGLIVAIMILGYLK
ncbi:MAG TPA: ATP synthase subunit C [Vicinamibacteria bacterium]